MSSPTREIINEAAIALQQDLELDLAPGLSEEALLQLLSEKIVAVIAQGPDPFFRLMYKLDIAEKKLNAVLNYDDTPYRIARLVYARQLQKIQSRRASHTLPTDNDPDLQW